MRYFASQLFLANPNQLPPGRERTTAAVRRRGLVAALCVTLCGVAVPAKAQEVPIGGTPAAEVHEPQPLATEIQPAALEAQVKRIEADETLSAEDKASLTAIYQQAVEAAKEAERLRAKAEEFAARIQSAPKDLVEVNRQLQDLKTNPDGGPPPRDLQKLKLELAKKESELTRLREEAAELEKTPKARLERQVKAPKRLSEIRDEIAEVERQLAAASSIDSPAARANRVLNTAKKARLSAEAAALEREIQSYAARSELLPLRTELTRQLLAREERLVKQIRERIDELTRRELERLAEEARGEALAADHPVVRELAEEYARLAERLMAVQEQTNQAEAAAADAAKREEQLRSERDTTTQRIKDTGLNATFGALLAKQRDQLPNRRELQRRIAARLRKADEIRLAQYELEDRIKQFPDDPDEEDEEIEWQLAQFPSAPEGALTNYLKDELRERLVKRKEIHKSLLAGYDKYLQSVSLLGAAEIALLRERDEFAAFINQAALWLPSMPAIGLQDAVGASHVLESLGQPGDWLALVQGLAADAAKNPLLAFAFVLSLVALVVLRPKLVDYIRDVGGIVQKGYFDRYAPTLAVAGASVVLAVPAAWILAYLAWRAANMDAVARLAVPVSSGLGALALVVLVVELGRQVCRPAGLAEAHFAWSEASMRMVRGLIRRWLIPVGVLVFLVASMAAMEDDLQATSLGRLAFVAGMLAAIVPLYRVLDPRGRLLRDLLASNRQGWLYRLRYVWFGSLVLMPSALALLAALGYYHTSLTLTARTFATLCFGAGLIITRDIIFRALLIARRRLAMEQARQRRAAARAAAESAEDGSLGESQAISFEEPLLDLSAISGQTRRLVRAVLVMTALVGTYAIWVDVLPALGVLDRVTLWTTEAGKAITLKSALLATLIGILTFVAWKNIPGLLEIAVLQQLPLEASSRFAVATLTSYFIAVVGVVLTFHQFGVGWGNVQWLVAAMTVGLGFGLQEIFANFVSGLIILFERPIRVGDVVTAGDVTGAVTKIRTRATTITNWDRKELIIPNKEFVTGRVMNWTLSDQVNRVTIHVHVAYGTDAGKVLEILEQIAQGHPAVLDDPPPMVSFEEFGVSAMNFVLRVYLPSLDVRLKTVTELHQEIQRRFADTGIEIALPQQDIRVRSIDAALPFLTKLADDAEQAA